MAQLIQLKKDPKTKKTKLEMNERNMLSVGYKNVVGTRRGSWRNVTVSSDDEDADLQKQLQKVIEEELEKQCRDVLSVIETSLLLPADDIKAMQQSESEGKVDKDQAESTIFYLKMCGDYYRYLAEIMLDDPEGQKCKKVKAAAEKNYKDAIDVAKVHLLPTHPTRLGLVLNASVCYYEILKKPKEARDLAKAGFDQAIQKLDSLSDSTYKDSTLIMQLLRDNLTIWTTDSDDANRED